jgi:hypothetical protein
VKNLPNEKCCWLVVVFWVKGMEGIHGLLFLLQLESDLGTIRMQSQVLHIYK